MKITIREKNYDVGKRLNSLIEKKLSKLERYFGENANCVVLCKCEKDRYILELTITNNGFTYRSEVVGANMFENLDSALPKIEKQIVRQSEKRKDLFKQTAFSLPTHEFFDDMPFIAEKKIVKKKSFELDPISVEDAKFMLDSLDHDFYIFLDQATNLVNVLYKRKDGELGLIEVKK